MSRSDAPTATALLPALILDADTRTALVAARALAAAGVTVTMGTPRLTEPALSSRAVADRVLLPSAEDDLEAYGEQILAWASRNPGCVIFPMTDPSVVALKQFRDELSAVGAPALPPEDALEVALSKKLTLEAAAACDIAVPRQVLVTSLEEALAAMSTVGYPCVAKPVESWKPLDQARGVRVVSAYVEDAAAAAEALTADDISERAPWLIQEYASGERQTVTAFRHDGRVSAIFGLGIRRTWPPLGGASVMRESIVAPPELVEQSIRLLETIGYEGYGEVEFRRDREGRPLLMEINPRLAGTLEVPARAGVDFVLMQYCWAAGLEVPDGRDYPAGVRLSWPRGELQLLRASMRRSPRPVPSLHSLAAELLRDYLPPPHIENLSLRDPMPTVATLKKMWRREPRAARAAARRNASPA